MAPALAAPWLVPRKLTQSGRSLTLSVCCLPGQHLCVCVCVCVCVSMCLCSCVWLYTCLYVKLFHLFMLFDCVVLFF